MPALSQSDFERIEDLIQLREQIVNELETLGTLVKSATRRFDIVQANIDSYQRATSRPTLEVVPSPGAVYQTTEEYWL